MATNRHTKSFSIKKKISLGFLLIISFFLMSVIITYILINSASKDAKSYLQEDLFINQEFIDLQGTLLEANVFLQRVVLLDDKSQLDHKEHLIDSIRHHINEINNNMHKIDHKQASEKWLQINDTINEYIINMNKLIESKALSKEQEVQIYKEQILPLLFKINENFNVDTLSKKNIGKEKGAQDLVNDILHLNMQSIVDDLFRVERVMITFLLLSIISSFIIAYYLSRSIINPLKHSVNIANDISSGKRNIVITNDRNDELGELLSALSVMNESIKEGEKKLENIAVNNKELYDSIVSAAKLFGEHTSLVSSGDLSKKIDLSSNHLKEEVMAKLGADLNDMTNNLGKMTNDIVKTCADMVSTLANVKIAVNNQSTGASEQASSINEITASITEIEKSAFQTMQKAKTLGEIAEKTQKSGQLGYESIQNSILGIKSVKDKVQLIARTILELSKQTQQVGEITAVVNNLAQQSKMLALNASIEAAKAGEAGKGFAVVATEVKNLAEQSEQSTSQVQKILENIKLSTEKSVMVTEEGTKGVDVGLELIEQTGEIIQNLNEVIGEAAMTSQQIEAAVRQETAAIEQITAGMSEINSVTGTFVDSIKDTTNAIEQLGSFSSQLKSSVDKYKL